jgi:L-alanine-DL-glutamate epimerase-like enolase superfamily enzyme
MKITRLRTRAVQYPLDLASGAGYDKQRSMGCVLTWLESDQGVVGQGLISTLNGKRLATFKSLVDSLAPLIEGSDPGFAGAFLQKAWADLRSNGARGMAALGVAAVETALWDLRAKLAGLNVARMIGACRPAVPAYISAGLWVDRSLDQLQAAAAGHVQRGFRAMKLRLTGDLERDPERVRAVREAIGPSIALLADANQRMDASRAMRLGRRLEAFGLEWIEDPVAYDDLRGSAAVAAALDTPIASGENASTARGADELLRAGAVDVLMVDLQRIGGPSEFLKSAHLAEAAGTPFASHLFSEMSLALLATISNAIYLECMPWHSPVYREPLELDERGRAVVPDRPGWGFEFDPEAVERFALG